MGRHYSQSTLMIFSRDYLRVFIPLAICFVIYHLTFVPWIEHRSYQTEKRWSADVLPETAEWWDEFFREDAWQRQSPEVLVTASGTLLYQKHEEISDTRWRIKPLTILIPQKSTGSGQRAILISNPEGAEIQFQSRPDWTSEPPPVESGRLLGDILIYAPPDENSGEGGLQIETSEVRIEKRQIWTDKRFKLQMGDSLIDGHFLTINLEQKILGSGPSNSPNAKTPFNGLDNLELTYVDRVRIGLKPGGLWPRADDPDALRRDASAFLKCGGRFTFNFPQSEATLRGGVQMEHRVDGLPTDTFNCEELTMQVSFKSNEEANAQPVDSQESKAPWTLEKLTAVGAMGRTPADRSRWMKLVAPGIQVEALGQRLFIDFANGELNLNNTLPLTATQESSPVYLRHESIQVWSPDIHYGNPKLFQKRGASQDAPLERIGTVIANGPGLAQMEKDSETWKISWGQKLVVRPMEELEVISIHGSANLSHSQQGTFAADKLDVWLRPTDSNRSQLLGGYYKENEVPRWLPEAMHAVGDVRVESAELIARVDSMKLTFTYPSQPVASGVQPDSTGNLDATANPPHAASSDTFQHPNQNLAVVRQPAGAHAAPDRPVTSPFSVAAKSLQATVLSQGAVNTIEALSLDGDFEMRREFLSESSPWPFSARGTQLRMRQTTPQHVNLHLIGEPAKVAVGTGEIVAPELQLSQSENLFYIDHPGVLVIPPEALKLGGPSDPNTSLVSTSSAGNLPNTFPPPLRAGGGIPSTFAPNTLDVAARERMKWIDPPRLQWGERMTFDGRTARFGGGVQFSCRVQTDVEAISHVSIQSQSMAVDLTAPIPLAANEKGKTGQAQVDMIRFEENVDIKVAHTGYDTQRTATEHMKIPRLDLFVPSQTFLGYGPGELWSRRFASKGQFPGIQPAPNALPAQLAAESQSLQCIHLSFMGRLEGDLKTKRASFFDRIEALMGPIKSWDDQVNVHHSERLAAGQTSLISDQINIFDGSALSYNQRPVSNASNATAWEIEALSRVRMETMSDKGRVTVEGNSMKYGARNDQVQVAGTPTQTAVITMFTADQPPSEMRWSNFSMELKTGNIRGNIDRFEGTLPPAFQRAGPTTATPPLPAAHSGVGLPDPRGSR